MGGSGSGRHRKSLDLKRQQIIEKAWEIIGELLNNPQADFNYKLQYAIDIVKKNIPQELKGEGFGDTKIIIIREKEKSSGIISRDLSIPIPQ